MSIYFFDKISKESIASFTPLRAQRQKAPGSGHILPLAAFVEISKKCLTSSGQCDIIFKYRLRKPVIGHIAGWSSSVARRAHNPKVVGSNPAPATSVNTPFETTQAALFFVFFAFQGTIRALLGETSLSFGRKALYISSDFSFIFSYSNSRTFQPGCFSFYICSVSLFSIDG